MSKKVKATTLSMLIILIVGAIGLEASSCNNSKMYREYENYGKGYEAGIKGGSQPSFWARKEEKEGYQDGTNDSHSAGNNSSIVGFRYTEEEIKSLENKWSTFEEMFDAALNGNRDVMFGIGICNLYGGKDLPVDVDAANIFFGNAASLGHAPSLEKIRVMYREELDIDMSKSLLHQVYLNLVIAMGHTEYTSQYHKIVTV